MFEQLFYKAILSYKSQPKKRKHQKVISLATLYITAVHLSVLFVVCIILVKATNSSFLRFYEIQKPIIYSILAAIVLYVFNMLYFNGKRLLQIKNKAIQENTKGTEVWKLWMVPLVIFGLSFILFKAA